MNYKEKRDRRVSPSLLVSTLRKNHSKTVPITMDDLRFFARPLVSLLARIEQNAECNRLSNALVTHMDLGDVAMAPALRVERIHREIVHNVDSMVELLKESIEGIGNVSRILMAALNRFKSRNNLQLWPGLRSSPESDE